MLIVEKPKTIKETLLWMYRFGHAWNPAYPNLRNVDEGRVRMMDGSERDAKDMIASWQKLDANVAVLVAAFHGRELEPDGEMGPASKAVMDYRRCGMSDYAPPPEASFDFGDEGLNGAMQSYQEWKQFAGELGGTGSWPNCDPQRPDVHSTRVSVLTAGFSSHQKSILPKVLKMVEVCEADMGHAVRHILDGDPRQTEKDVRAKNIPGNVIGYCYFPKPNTCNQTIECRIDNTFNVDAFITVDLFIHEYDGHGDGHEHSGGGPTNNRMNPSIGRPTKAPTWRGDKQEKVHAKYFTGVSLGPPEPIPGQAPEFLGRLKGEQGPNGIAIRGVIDVVVKSNQKPGTFRQIVVPAGTPGEFQFEPKTEL